MTARHVSEATMRVRDVIYTGLLVRNSAARTSQKGSVTKTRVSHARRPLMRWQPCRIFQAPPPPTPTREAANEPQRV